MSIRCDQCHDTEKGKWISVSEQEGEYDFCSWGCLLAFAQNVVGLERWWAEKEGSK